MKTQEDKKLLESYLTYVSKDGHSDLVKDILAAPDINVNAIDENGNTALIWSL